MRILCVDDEVLLARNTADVCSKLPEVDEAVAFTKGREALEWLESNTADIAILDIDMPDMTGLQLAARIRSLYPETKIIFLTGFRQFAADAFKLRATGYLLKPVTEEELAEEIDYAMHGEHKKSNDRVVIQTFGNFDIFADGELVTFKQKKCKELLAILVDRHGGSVSRADAVSLIYEDRPYDRSMQKQFDAIVRFMRETLKEYGIDDIFEMKGGRMRICPEKVSCDFYQFLNGDIDAVNKYRGEYMSSYAWADMTEAFITSKSKLIAE